MTRTVQYCTVADIADYLHIDINANTDPNTTMVQELIMDAEDDIDHKTGHSWRTDKQYSEVFNVNEVYHYGRGMYLGLKHRNIKAWDESEGDLLEIWNGRTWVAQTVTDPDEFVNIEDYKGTLYIRGYIYTILRNNRFRLTYRYGGAKEHDGLVPRDIKRCCIKMVCIEILSTDWQRSDIPYGADGAISKEAIIGKWDEWIKQKIWEHSEILTVN